MSDCSQSNNRSMRTPPYRQGTPYMPNMPQQGNASMPRGRNAMPVRNMPGSDAYADFESSCALPEEDGMRGYPIAMGYVPWQHWHDIYEPEKALYRATIFMELDKPFSGYRGGRKA